MRSNLRTDATILKMTCYVALGRGGFIQPEAVAVDYIGVPGGLTAVARFEDVDEVGLRGTEDDIDKPVAVDVADP